MKKDKRTQTERISAHKRELKRDLKEKKRLKANANKKMQKKAELASSERKFQEHMARLQGELGIKQ